MNSNKLTGVTLIKNGNQLGYPWKQCINNMLMVCDEVWVSVDPTGTDTTYSELIVWSVEEPRLKLFPSEWNMANIKGGTEFANQINVVLPRITEGWILYLQADEFVHPKDRRCLRQLINDCTSEFSQIELFRTYFWGDLQSRAPKFEIWLGRVFRVGTHIVGGDGMWIERHSGHVRRAPIAIYHYSRIGRPDLVTARIRANDVMHHPSDIVETFKEFSYDDPERGQLDRYNGSHPIGIEEFYGSL